LRFQPEGDLWNLPAGRYPACPRPIPSRDSSLVLTYRIDAGDRISYVNPAWTEFARANQGEAVLPEKVLGSSLLDATDDLTVRALYRTMIQHVRAGQPVRFHYRCDAPDRRRTFEMEIVPLADGEVEFVSTLLHEEPRPPVALLQKEARRDERLLRVCSWCQRVALPDNSWVPVEAAVEALHLLEAETFPRLTHGICDPCCGKLRQESGIEPEV
jgi:hypothetical protein